MSGRPVVFLDKDGTVVEDLPYNVDPSRVRLAPGARQGLRLLGAARHPLVIASNQSGVARGYATLADLDRLGAFLHEEFAALGAELVGVLWCPHLPEGINEYAVECACRKPLPGLIDRAVAELGVDPTGGWFVGDTWMDVAAGRAAGLRTILVGPERVTVATLPDDRRPDHAVADLLDAAMIIVSDRITERPAVEASGSSSAR
jgi:D-glycero-D-manno-heptose 1,7-bisphosphate phosphatase